MKKIFYIVSAALILAIACERVDSEKNLQNTHDYPEGTTVEVSFTAEFPDSKVVRTRVAGDMAEEPDIQNMYVAIFGQSSNANGGQLQYWIPVEFVNWTGDWDGHNTKGTYTVQLPLIDEGVELHFIANYPFSDPPLFDREKVVMDRIYSSFTFDDAGKVTATPGAYWQKISLNDGIQGTYSTSAQKFIVSDDTKNAIATIPFVRNYAKIRITNSSTAPFKVMSYALVNVPDKGYIAPYDVAHRYNTKYTEIDNYVVGNFSQFYTDLTGGSSNYPGYMPGSDAESIYYSNPGASSAVVINTSSQLYGTGTYLAEGGLYMYEHPVPTVRGRQTAAIVEIKWNNSDDDNPPTGGNAGLAGKTYYYKIELLDNSGNYLPILRNIQYTFNLSSIEGDAEATFDAAYEGAYFGDVSASVETATLNELSDGNSRIIVSRMDYPTVKDNDEVVIYYKYYPVDGVEGSLVTTTTAHPTDPYVSVTKNAVSGYLDAIDSFVADGSTETNSSSDYYGWGKITVKLKAKGTATLRNKLRVQGNNGGKRILFRDIVFTVMNYQDFQTGSTHSKLVADGTNVTLTIQLPEELPSSIFPIQVRIESKDNNLSPSKVSADLPVNSGESYWTSGKNTFYFTKTISWSDYAKINKSTGLYEYVTAFPCYFTNTDTSITTSKVVLSSEYFNTLEL